METRGHAFPSLLFTGEPRRGDVCEEVFRDLKLNSLLDAEGETGVAAVMSGIPPRGDVGKRRELFDEVREMRRQAGGTFTDDPFGDAGFTLWEAKNYDRAYGSRRGDAKAVVFACLCRIYCDFCRKASELNGKSFLLKRFSDYFKEYRKSDGFSLFEAEAERVCGLLPGFYLECRYRTGEGLSEASETPREGFVSRICSRMIESGEDPDEIWADDADAPDERVSDAFAERLVSLYPEAVKAARAFYENYRGFYDAAITGYDGEFDFIHRILSLEERIEEAGLPLCTPTLTDRREIRAKDAYDVTLLCKNERNIVPNDVELTENEPFFFLSGANGGGKTTYLRAVGVNVLLALSGARTAAGSFEVGPVDRLLTHFPQDEDFVGEGRFESELRRAEEILYQPGEMPLILLNETFSTTNENKSRRETEAYAEKLLRRGAFGVYVTHTAGVSVPGVGSLICETDKEDPGRRTYRIVRAKQTDGARAADLIGKYGLTPDALRRRFAERREDEE